MTRAMLASSHTDGFGGSAVVRRKKSPYRAQ
jgi:hypothetical protein